MAKKARKKMEEDAIPAFEFPPFDEAGFVWKEYELAAATGLAGLVALVLGLVTWALTAVGLPWFLPLSLGFAGLVGSFFLIRGLRPNSGSYTKGDWAGLIALEFFGWVAIWFLLLNIAASGL
ncbi:MAG TPA: hypothetical protein VN842_04015 [Thermoplasmata archaeon]|nr:hypothetical protein [Thermoplasmata archaeon]